MKKISTSCDPNIQHVLFDHGEVVHWVGDIHGRLIYVTKDGFDGKLIGVHACEKDGTLIENGLIVVLENGVWVRQKNLNVTRLGDYMDLDEEGRIRVMT